MSAADSYYKIKEHVNLVARNCGRNPKEITLIAVSKKISLIDMQSAYDAGCRYFGENQVQESLIKILEAPSDIYWHLIGTLQKNKVKKVIGKFEMIHSVDNFALAEKISECSLQEGINTKILLQVNTSGEQSKHGLSEKEWMSLFSSLMKLPNISIEGLMTIAPNTDNRDCIRDCFKKLRCFRDELNTKVEASRKLFHLSMGMTNDYPIAIEEGATLLRIGSAIFGERQYKK